MPAVSADLGRWADQVVRLTRLSAAAGDPGGVSARAPYLSEGLPVQNDSSNCAGSMSSGSSATVAKSAYLA